MNLLNINKIFKNKIDSAIPYLRHIRLWRMSITWGKKKPVIVEITGF
jgi:hypothetical protein